nr:hypothetical protein [Tanacetum cinerariifolium]
SSSKLARDQTSNPTSFANPTPKGQIRRSPKQKVENSHFEENLTPVATMTDNHTMAEMLRAPPEGSELAKLTHAVNQQTSAVTTAMTAMLKQFQSNPSPAQVKAVEEICVTCGATSNYNQGNPGYRPQGSLQLNTASTSRSGTLPGNTIDNPKGELKAITTRSGLATKGPTVPNPPRSVNPKEDECVEETYTDPDHAEYTIKVPPPPPVQKPKPSVQRNFVLHTRDSLPPHIPDPGKFLIPCGFSELKCKALADLGASINLMPLDPRVPLILGRPFLRIARALTDVHGEEIILRDGDERLTLNMKHDTASYSNHPCRELVNLINIFNISSEDCLEDLVSNNQSGNPTFSLHKEIASPEVIHEIHDSNGCTFLSEELPDIDSFNDIHPHFDDDPLSGSTTYSANSLLEEDIEFLLYQGEDSDFKDSIDQSDLANCDDLFVDPTPKMFTDEQPPDYSFPLRFDVYPDDFLEIKSDDADTFDDYFFDSEGEKIKDSELLIDQLDLPCDILSEYDSFNSQDFFGDDDLPSPDNEDKVFNPGILIHKKSVKIITRVAQEKKLAISYASLLFEDFDPLFYELLVFKAVPNSMRLLPFSSENEEKVFKPGIYTSKKVKEYQENDKIGLKPEKREAWRSREKSKAVTVSRGSKTEENAKRIVRNANTCMF